MAAGVKIQLQRHRKRNQLHEDYIFNIKFALTLVAGLETQQPYKRGQCVPAGKHLKCKSPRAEAHPPKTSLVGCVGKIVSETSVIVGGLTTIKDDSF